MPLTELEVKNARPKEKRYQLPDGNCLYLEITPIGTKSWKMRQPRRGDFPIHTASVKNLKKRFQHSYDRKAILKYPSLLIFVLPKPVENFIALSDT